MVFLVLLPRHQFIWLICWCFTTSLAMRPPKLDRFSESSPSSSSLWASGEDIYPPSVHSPQLSYIMDHLSIRGYPSDSTQPGGRSTSPPSPHFSENMPLLNSQASYDHLSVPDPSSASHSDYPASLRSAGHSELSPGDESDGEMERTSSRKRKFSKSYLSDSDASYSPLGSPIPYSDGLIASHSGEHELNDADSSKARRIDYFEYFANEKLKPLPEDNHPHKMDEEVVESFYNDFVEILPHKKTDFPDRYEAHKELPFARVTHKLPYPGRPSEVLMAGEDRRQGEYFWKILYKNLITELSKQHAEGYTYTTHSKYEYKEEQTKLLRWLNKEIFAPFNSLPVLGLSRYSFGSEGLGDSLLQPNQIELIRYFSQDATRSHLETERAVSHLLKSYKNKPEPRPEETMPYPRSLSKQKQKHLDTLVERWGGESGLYYCYKYI
ncbi:hypothetical protein MJO29_003244 [Puccinia striiformis f. sp. tritici]|uniref:hypothetical protein n=1 Tax=Puccinia striiformis f. sp. tritici TaxID=168172 RepID=UPI0020078E32|nr:hypothetical protein Pst134EA_004926 [Puccinia striiformis f. sp. tritici]KAH9471016.1 hypothetical protein Pst134EA_004926 [Puccinia striiformis f. sp. tritici]KAI7965146.1 hypothetical protein MJO29_003244 [Puccinia striiformis f. sp. tritici]